MNYKCKPIVFNAENYKPKNYLIELTFIFGTEKIVIQTISRGITLSDCIEYGVHGAISLLSTKKFKCITGEIIYNAQSGNVYVYSDTGKLLTIIPGDNKYELSSSLSKIELLGEIVNDTDEPDWCIGDVRHDPGIDYTGQIKYPMDRSMSS